MSNHFKRIAFSLVLLFILHFLQVKDLNVSIYCFKFIICYGCLKIWYYYLTSIIVYMLYGSLSVTFSLFYNSHRDLVTAIIYCRDSSLILIIGNQKHSWAHNVREWNSKLILILCFRSACNLLPECFLIFVLLKYTLHFGRLT